MLLISFCIPSNKKTTANTPGPPFQLKILNLVTSANSILPLKVTFTGSKHYTVNVYWRLLFIVPHCITWHFHRFGDGAQTFWKAHYFVPHIPFKHGFSENVNRQILELLHLLFTLLNSSFTPLIFVLLHISRLITLFNLSAH